MEDLVAQKLDVLIRFADSCKGALRFRYEDFVAGKVDALEDYLGFKVPVQPDVPEDLKRVERTRSSGSWRRWFTDEDLPWAKRKLEPMLRRLDYAVDWDLADQPIIDPDHAHGYVMRILKQKAELLKEVPVERI